MASEEFGEKTEQPTEHRRTEARRKGNVARSGDLNAAGLMLAAALAVSLFGLSLFSSFGRLIEASLKTVKAAPLDAQTAADRFSKLFQFVLVSAAPFVLLLAAAAILVNVMQVGFLVTPEAVQPKASRLNPLEGFKRIFSIRAVVRLLGSLAKFVVVIAVAALFTTSALPAFLALTGSSPVELLTVVHSSVVKLAFALSLALVALALLDFTFQKWKHEQELRMSKQEVREELKQFEGDPHLRMRRREAHRKLAAAREMQAVRTADVVITNPTHISVALKYDPQTMAAPTVVAKGMGVIAERIRRIAQESGVPIIERRELVRALYRTVRVGAAIPVDMYETFVEIMAYLYRLTGRTPPGLG